jgi:hypothetical protein
MEVVAAEASLRLSAVNLRGGVQWRRQSEDELERSTCDKSSRKGPLQLRDACPLTVDRPTDAVVGSLIKGTKAVNNYKYYIPVGAVMTP